MCIERFRDRSSPLLRCHFVGVASHFLERVIAVLLSPELLPSFPASVRVYFPLLPCLCACVLHQNRPGCSLKAFCPAGLLSRAVLSCGLRLIPGKVWIVTDACHFQNRVLFLKGQQLCLAYQVRPFLY